MNPGGGYWYGYGYQQPQVPLRKGWTKRVPGPSHFGAYHAFYSPTTGLSGGGKWGAEAIKAKIDSNPVGALQELCQKVKVVPFYSEVVGAPRHTVQVIISPVL